MTTPKKQDPPPSPAMRKDLEARAVYSAMMWASSNGCQCQSCAILRRLYQRVAGLFAEAALKSLDEGE